MANPFQHEHTRIDRGRLLVDTDLEPRPLAITPEGYLQIETIKGTSGIESVGNSTDVVLSAGEVFTGEWEEITDYAMIKVFIYSDQESAIGGLKFQQSPDKVLIDSEVYEYTKAIQKMFTPNPVSKWFRMVYTNGPVDQTVFNLSVIYSYVYSKPSSHRVGDNVVGNDDAELVKAVLAVRNETDDAYYNVGIQRPLSVEGRSIYAQNLWIAESVATDWTDKDLTGQDIIEIPFTNLNTRIENATATNPKILTLHFNRTVNAHQLGMGCTGGGDFSNVKLVLLGSGGVERFLLDDSANSTKYVSKNYKFTPELFNGIRIEYHTTDTITVSNLTIQKATPVEAALKAMKDDGVLTFIGASDSGNLRTTDAESGLAIAKGDVLGSSFIHKFGKAGPFGTSDGFVTLWDGADDTDLDAMVYTYSTDPIIDSISSSSTADTQPIEVQGLDTDYNRVVQTITLSGQARVALTTNLIRVFRLKNVGVVDLAGHCYCFEDTALSGGIPILVTKARALIHGVNNQTLMAVYTIPAGYTGYMRDWFVSAAKAFKSSTHEIKLFARPFGQVFQLKHDAAISLQGTSYFQHKYTEPEKFTEKTDIEIRANTDEVDAAVSGGFDIVLIAN